MQRRHLAVAGGVGGGLGGGEGLLSKGGESVESHGIPPGKPRAVHVVVWSDQIDFTAQRFP
jgi:hypothetical protein